ncbi:MAG: hypothetical protein CO013_10970 [Syntrophobacterales bacterium CG_4_8_14_3_um_filter_58_8]|nr:MAG: hypothetical protein CO013_10970 [Syntrophobacterales bacterium CG_4_8_14_3_um_filter_58_8]
MADRCKIFLDKPKQPPYTPPVEKQCLIKNYQTNKLSKNLIKGQGSSREHAVMAPMSIGMKVVIAKSFARIYRRNMINNGVVPLIFQNAADYEFIRKGDLLFIDRLVEQIQKDRVVVENRSRGNTFETILDLTPRERGLLLKGGLLGSLRAAP